MLRDMSNFLTENIKNNVSIIHENNKSIIKFGNGDEYGIIESYKIFPGVFLYFNDMHFFECFEFFSSDKINRRFIEINHCFSGKYECKVGKDKLAYFSKGDLDINKLGLDKIVSRFPLGYYKGLGLLIDVDVANESLNKFISPNLDLNVLYDKLLEKNNGYLLLKSNNEIDHVIGEIYNVDERIKEPYFKLKIVELLLFFSISDFDKDEKMTFSLEQVNTIKNIKKELVNNLDVNITLDDLVNKYGISKTSLKNCFKEVYGKPIFTWRKEYKLDYACKLIDEGKYNISQIASMVGYKSPSKFTKAFKEYIGCTPSEYRKI
ncbi:response regulator transcription factor [uncultured Methanobrevibacter sp.]|uniref:AraC family transcriptional regulator n=1 Tax=uncultured Methanobrevibacter sp. TaxID=253161 RepID=UPI002611781A|nr:response regulator transcription factor [uncultured Methanobrevibacter sp.]